MTLELRPNCEYCDRDLPPDSLEAMICSYECTFCRSCVEERLANVCPNCGGGLAPRPVRPRQAWRPGVSLEHQPASTRRRALSHDPAEIAAFSSRVSVVAPEDR